MEVKIDSCSSLGGGEWRAASAAADCMSLREDERGRGRECTRSGKLRVADVPLRKKAAES